ncbi:hypothetical protein PGIGA_G00194260 [Pangasianodon gigas]|uniref:Uncharacterized protein n=1 Tax=Pangasianodon gigas TaxID=30993 RepID=A0ACC5XWP0_PANGG|nr:hypothetical protein [Pangasianodon gigas]
MVCVAASKAVCDPELIADQIGISALIIQDFKGPLTADYVFDWERVLQAQGDTGVFLQYTHARLRSLLRTHGNETLTHFDASHLQDRRSISILQHLLSLLRTHGNETLTHFDASHLQDRRSISILQHLLRYDEVLLQSALELQPRYLVNFLLTLCHLVSSAHRDLPVKGSATDVAQARLHLFAGTCSVLANGMKILGARLHLFAGTCSVLANGMKILGVTPVEKM